MPLDWDRPFGEIFPDPRDLRKQLVNIAAHTFERTIDERGRRKYLAVKKHSSSKRCSTSAPACAKETCGRCSKELVCFSHDHAQRLDLTLSLVRSSEEYLAVSYCWNSGERYRTNSSGESDPISDVYDAMPVFIEQLDGTVREARAPRRILRRAIRHAAAEGLRHIWIDQECIEQQDSAEKERAIASMDEIYRDAHTVLPLLDARLEDKLVLAARKALALPAPSLDFDMTRGVIQWLRHPPAIEAFLDAADDLCSILEFVATDRWFTRAWILQERLCSDEPSGSSTLWLMCKPELGTEIPGEVSIEARSFNLAMPELLRVLEKKDANTKNRVQVAYNKFCDAYDVAFDMAKQHRLQNKVNVMQATRWLANKGCTIAADKIALVGNCCDWYTRVGAEFLEMQNPSYSACIWALAIMNQDASLFCQDRGCATDERGRRMLWVPRANTTLLSLKCPSATSSGMRITEYGLATEGWLWKAMRVLDLSSVARSWQHQFTGQLNLGLLKVFFWKLLRRLTLEGEHDVANLLWKGVKYRGYGGFYGRDLREVPDVPFDQILDSTTGDYSVTYPRLGFEDREAYCKTADDFTSAYDFYHRFCLQHSVDERHQCCDVTKEENFHVLLGDEAQMGGFVWIIEAIWKMGRLVVGCHVDEGGTHDESALVLSDGDHRGNPYIFTQFRPVTKHKHGDPTEKKMLTWSYFDVWRADRESHQDTPFSWSAYKQRRDGHESENVTALSPCNVLFDISKVKHQDHTLDWPEEFYRESWERPFQDTDAEEHQTDGMDDSCRQKSRV